MRVKLLFHKYLANDCSPEEVEELILLLQEEQSSGALTNDMRALWDHLPENTPLKHVNWDVMLEQIKQQPPVGPARAGRTRRITLWTSGVAAAAVLSLLAVRYFNVTPAAKAPGAEVASAYTMVMATAAKQFVYLPDGSTVVLNTGSSLRYDPMFGKTNREVFLEGEGYFDIKQDAGHPFIVRSGELSTRVLGTAFNVNAYPGSKDIKVTVTQGKVQVSDKTEKTLGLLTANEQMVFDRKGEKAAKQVVNAVKETAWKPEELVIDDKTLAELAHFLEARYGCKILIAGEALKQQRVSATFREKDSLKEILEVVCEVSGSRFTEEKNVFTIK